METVDEYKLTNVHKVIFKHPKRKTKESVRKMKVTSRKSDSEILAGGGNKPLDLSATRTIDAPVASTDDVLVASAVDVPVATTDDVLVASTIDGAVLESIARVSPEQIESERDAFNLTLF